MRNIFFIFLSISFLTACDVSSGTSGKRKKINLNEVYTTKSGLQYEMKSLGEGQRPKVGDKVFVHYTGKLLDGTKFDSSYDRGKPFSFVLGKGKVIKGWDEGVALLHVGDKAVFTIPSKLAYGSADLGIIPMNSTLVFDVELVKLEAGQ